MTDNEATLGSWDNILDIIERPLQKKVLALDIRQKFKINKQFTIIASSQKREAVIVTV